MGFLITCSADRNMDAVVSATTRFSLRDLDCLGDGLVGIREDIVMHADDKGRYMATVYRRVYEEVHFGHTTDDEGTSVWSKIWDAWEEIVGEDLSYESLCEWEKRAPV